MIRLVEQKDVNNVYAISNEQLGQDYIKKQALEEMLNSDQVVILVFEQNNELLGFLLYEIIDKNRLKHELKIINANLEKIIKTENNFGFLNIVAVSEKAKGKGVGSALNFEIVKIMEQKGIKFSFSLAWKDKEKINIGNILLRVGYIELYEIENYYYEDSIKRNYTCPTCGNPPCKCSAIVYIHEKKTV